MTEVPISETDWMKIEKALAEKENDLLKKEGIIIPEGHIKGYTYAPITKIKNKESWDTFALPPKMPSCSSANWKHQDVNFEIGDGIAYLTLNRPDSNNSLNESLSQALYDATFELTTRRDIRIVVLRAEGKMFCAGGDPKSFADALAMSDRDNRKAQMSFMKFLHLFQKLPQFTIGLVQGSVMGSGIGLLSVCDVVAAVRTARFTVSEVKLGIAPLAIAPFVTAKVGPANAKRMLCMGDNVSADLAKSMGLVTEVFEDEIDFSKYVEGVCEKMTLCAPNAASRAKGLVLNVALRPLGLKLFEYVGSELGDIRIGEEAIKGMVAVQAKTKPYWAERPIKPLY
jgi:methylglutaconyl-CoA hydratase